MSTVSSSSISHDIVARMIEADGRPVSDDLAQCILGFQFSETERDRVDWLSERNRAGTITVEEEAELEDFIQFGDFLSLMKAKALATKSNSCHGNSH